MIAYHTSHVVHETVCTYENWQKYEVAMNLNVLFHYVLFRLYLTIDPRYYDALPERLPQKGDAAGRVVVKQLEDIHPSLVETESASGQFFMHDLFAGHFFWAKDFIGLITWNQFPVQG